MKPLKLVGIAAITFLVLFVAVSPYNHYMLAHGVSVGLSHVSPRPPAKLHKPAHPRIVVHKSAHRLYLFDGQRRLRAYEVAFGPAPLRQDKLVEGDNRTPTGNFTIVQKTLVRRLTFTGTRWMRIGYPNPEDAQRGLRSGLISQAMYRQTLRAHGHGAVPPQHTKLGGGIGIHGGGFTVFGRPVLDWTKGSIGMYDRDAEELYALVPTGTPVYIRY